MTVDRLYRRALKRRIPWTDRLPALLLLLQAHRQPVDYEVRFT